MNSEEICIRIVPIQKFNLGGTVSRRTVFNDVIPLVFLVVIASILSPFIIKRQNETGYTTSFSFPADTLIQSSDGLVPISRVYPGMMIRVFNSLKASWEDQPVSINTEKSYTGTLMEVSMGDRLFQVTSGHLFLVLSGENLDDRVLPIHEIPSDLPEVDGAQWILAEKLMKGDLLFSMDEPVEISNVKKLSHSSIQVFSLSLEKGQVYAVSPMGIAAADRSLVTTSTMEEDSYRGGACFPAGTVVSTVAGFRGIESLKQGERLFSMSPGGSVEEKTISGTVRQQYKGEMIRIQLENEVITATTNHPFLVWKSSVGQTTRPIPEDLGEDSLLYYQGFWVEAGDLEVEDLLIGNEGSHRILGLERYQDELDVYNVQIEDNHTYAVGESSVVVHNKGASESSAPIEESESSGLLYDYEEPMIDEDVKRAASPEDIGEAPVTTTKTSDSGPQESGLKAGYADDNKQFNYFLGFLEEYKSMEHFDLDVRERIILRVLDNEKASLANLAIRIYQGDDLLCRGTTLSDGRFYFFPSEYRTSARSFRYEVDIPGTPLNGTFSRDGERELQITTQLSASEFPQPTLDIVFVLDTTGSMGGEIQRLKETIEIIKLNLSNIRGLSRVRFGLQLYKDRGDEYITRSTLITEDLETFQRDLDEVYASGGGDGPEDLQAALDSALNRMNWDSNALRLAFIITDAPPHLDYENSVSYVDSARLAREKGIKLYSVGTGGLNTGGEYILRQLSQYTGARYIFLTYGESGESEGGVEGSVSHHTGENYSTDKLESIIIQFAREELSYVLPISLDSGDEYFTARPVDSETREETLQKLFSDACHQLVDYSSLNLEAGTPTALTPFSLQPAVDPVKSEFLEAQLQYTLASQMDLKELFTLVERQNLQQIMDELKLNLSGVINEESSVEIGKFLGAQWIITGEVHPQGQELHIFLKLMRVETGEILSITKVIVPESLLP